MATAPIVIRTETWATRALRSLRRGFDRGIAGAIGAVFGLYFYVELVNTNNLWIRDALAGAFIGGMIGFLLNASEAYYEGSWLRLARTSSWGAVAGAIGGAIGLLIGEKVLGGFQGGLTGRAVSWGILGLGIGVSQGLGQHSWQKLRLGVIGGVVGGFIGGFFFEAIRDGLGNRYDLSQAVGMVILGGGLGLALALVEGMLGRVWVHVLNGRQEGRSYLIGNKATIGLDERADVGLFGDPLVARRHAEIVKSGGDFQLTAFDGQQRTKVNGVLVGSPVAIVDGDRIELGGTILQFRKR